MSRKKGLSFEEKRSRLLEIFYEKKEPFLLKDLEKIAPKEKSIPAQTVKEVLTSLVNDDMVDTDKIGLSTYFWAFPSKGLSTKVNKVKELEAKLKELEKKDSQLKITIEERVKSSRENEADAKRRIEIQEKLIPLQKEREDLQKKIDHFKDCDPDTFAQMEAETKLAREAVERWTDNVFAIKSWCKKKYNMEDNEICKNLNIPPDFDYFES